MSHDDHFIKDLHNCIGVWFSVYPDASSNGLDSRSQRMWLRKIRNCVRSSKSAVNIILLSADDVFALIVGSSSVSEVASSCQ
jgi:hypothetical protein